MSTISLCEACPQRGVCSQHDLFRESLVRIERSMREGFDSMSRTFKEVAADLREGAVTIGNLKTRIGLMEKLLYGAAGTALTGVLLAILALVLKGGA
jgi:hypothetical protein